MSHSTDNICYFGNDDNDIEAAKLCKLVICPINAYPKFKKISNYYTSAKGGEGVLREFMEKIYMWIFYKKITTMSDVHQKNYFYS